MNIRSLELSSATAKSAVTKVSCMRADKSRTHSLAQSVPCTLWMTMLVVAWTAVYFDAANAVAAPRSAPSASGPKASGKQGKGSTHHQQQEQVIHMVPQQSGLPLHTAVHGAKEYCYYETFDAKCPDGEAVVMTAATYGRMQFGRCVKTNFGFIGCSINVLDLLDRRCSGRQGCSVEVVEPTFDSVQPCNTELKSYLEADYRCLKVVDYAAADCNVNLDRDDRVIAVGSLPTGITQGLGGGVSNAPPCGTESNPWKIQVSPGQRVNVSLIDFTAASASSSGLDAAAAASGNMQTGSGSNGGSGCFRSLGRVYEPLVKRSADVCMGQPGVRDSHVYMTQSSPIEFYAGQSSSGGGSGSRLSGREHEYFVVFTAVGCPNYTAAGPDAWVRYSADRSTAEVGCRQHGGSGTGGGGQTWQLVCRGHEWTGFVDNCSMLLAASQSSSVQHENNFLRLSSVVIALIVTGVSTVISLCVLIVGLLVFKRMRFQPVRSNARLRSRVVMTCPATADVMAAAAADRHFRLPPEMLEGVLVGGPGTRCQLYRRRSCDGGNDLADVDDCSVCRKCVTVGDRQSINSFRFSENGVAARSENEANEIRYDQGDDGIGAAGTPSSTTGRRNMPGMAAEACCRSYSVARRPTSTSAGVGDASVVDCSECPECMMHAAAAASALAGSGVVATLQQSSDSGVGQTDGPASVRVVAGRPTATVAAARRYGLLSVRPGSVATSSGGAATLRCTSDGL